MGGDFQIYVLDVRTNCIFIHILRQMRQHGEHGVIICFIQPPARRQSNKRPEENTERTRTRTHKSTQRYLRTPRHAQTRNASPKMRCPSQILAATSRGMFFENSVNSQDSRYMSACCDVQGAEFKQIAHRNDIVIQPMGGPCNNRPAYPGTQSVDAELGYAT